MHFVISWFLAWSLNSDPRQALDIWWLFEESSSPGWGQDILTLCLILLLCAGMKGNLRWARILLGGGYRDGGLEILASTGVRGQAVYLALATWNVTEHIFLTESRQTEMV